MANARSLCRILPPFMEAPAWFSQFLGLPPPGDSTAVEPPAVDDEQDDEESERLGQISNELVDEVGERLLILMKLGCPDPAAEQVTGTNHIIMTHVVLLVARRHALG